MTSHYSIRKLAEADLEEIWFYTFTQWGVEQADSYTRSLLSRIAWLAENPSVGKQRDDVRPGYHCFPEGMHLIYYLVTKKGIDVIGIPHQCMDVLDYF